MTRAVTNVAASVRARLLNISSATRMGKPIMDFSNLTVAERIQLAEDLWDSLAEVPEVLALSKAQRAELDRRLVAHRSEPEATLSWDALRQELLAG